MTKSKIIQSSADRIPLLARFTLKFTPYNGKLKHRMRLEWNMRRKKYEVEDETEESWGSYAEVFHGDSQRVQHLRVNRLFFQVNQVHLLTNLLQRGFRAERCQVRPDVAVGLGRDALQVHVIREFHVLGVDAQHFQPAGRVRNANVHFPIESACKKPTTFSKSAKHEPILQTKKMAKRAHFYKQTKMATRAHFTNKKMATRIKSLNFFDFSPF